MIKLIASDLDDTLLGKNAQLSAENRQAITAAREQDMIFTICTGRMFQATVPYALQLGLGMEQPIVCYNGALVRRLSGETLYEQSLSTELSATIVEYGQGRGWTINGYFDDELYVATVNQAVQDYADRNRVKIHAVGDLVKFIQDGNKTLSKLMVISEPDQTMERIEQLHPLVGENVLLARSRPKFIEITNPQAHKGKALLWLAESLGIRSDEVMAIGDSNNDISMLKVAGVSVAVANAPQEVQEVVDHIVAANYEHGVAEAIAKFALHSR